MHWEKGEEQWGKGKGRTWEKRDGELREGEGEHWEEEGRGSTERRVGEHWEKGGTNRTGKGALREGAGHYWENEVGAFTQGGAGALGEEKLEALSEGVMGASRDGGWEHREIEAWEHWEKEMGEQLEKWGSSKKRWSGEHWEGEKHREKEVGALLLLGVGALREEEGRVEYRKDKKYLHWNFQSNPTIQRYQGSEIELGSEQAFPKWWYCEYAWEAGGVGGETIETDRKTGKLVIFVLVEWVTRGRV